MLLSIAYGTAAHLRHTLCVTRTAASKICFLSTPQFCISAARQRSKEKGYATEMFGV